MVSEDLRRSLMDCKLCCTSPLPWIWVLETLTCSNQIDVSLLLDLVKKTPEISGDICGNARELVSLKILETIYVDGAYVNSTTASVPRIGLDPSERCEDVLRRIFPETYAPNTKAAAAEISQWDIKPFIAHKRSSLATKYSLQQLKDAILSGFHSPLASLKEKSGLPVGNEPEHRVPVDTDDCNGIETRLEGRDTGTQICAASDSSLLRRVLSNENVPTIKRKRSDPIENTELESREDQIMLGDGCNTNRKVVKKYKSSIICAEQYLDGILISTEMDRQTADISKLIVQCSDGEGCSLAKSIVGGMGLKGLQEDEVLPREEQVLHYDSGVPNDKSNEEQVQENCDNECFSKLHNRNEDSNRFELNVQTNAPDIGKGPVDINIISEKDGNADDMTDIATNKSASFGSQCKSNLDSAAKTDLRDINHPQDDKGEKSALSKRTRDGNIVPFDDGVVLPCENLVTHHDIEVPDNKFDEEHRQGHDAEDIEEGFHEPQETYEDTEKLDENIQSEAEEEIDSSSDSDGYHDERADIAKKKHAFLSSQCTFSQDSLATDWRELNRCMRCEKGENLLVCSSKSCPIVIHESCLGCDASFDTNGKFYCPFCAYSRAISKYTKAKEKASFARTNLSTFISLRNRNEPKKQFPGSCSVKERHLVQHDNLPKSDESNAKNFLKKVNDCKSRGKLEVKKTRPSLPGSGDKPSSRAKEVDSTNRPPRDSNKTKEKGNWKGKFSQSRKAYGPRLLAAAGVCKSQGKSTSNKVQEKTDEHAEMRSNKGVLCHQESDSLEESDSPSESDYEEEISDEETTRAGGSKYFIRVPKQEKKYTYPALPQLRRTPLPWSTAEEEMLKDGIQKICGPHDKFFPWKKILEFGAGTFHETRTTVDLKDKWRNMCKASPKKK